ETENADIFFTLCNDLIQKTEPVKEIMAAMEILFARLERWRSFLSRTRKNLLSDREVQGLFCELKFIEECIDRQFASHAAIIEGWHGPLGGPHDFVFGQSAVEIKSVAGSQSDSVPISSENQLQTHLGRLYLNVFLLSRDADCTTGISLNDLVRQMRERFEEKSLKDAFEERLMESGYIDIPEYDLPCFAVSEIRTYLVGENFPCITPDILPQGIREVSYRISFSSIADYLCDISAIGGKA
ncbi:MAG: PD-(D/E)XK motif protein, partial [Planctomycetaceae bacterium]|nr:PD-(D/E)XK motif protein [Planctomycetaceae bacterium]